MNKRIVYIDFIKVFLTCMVVAHHAGQAYGATGGVWLISDSPELGFLKPFFFINAAYMMGFYFFISGFFTPGSLKKKTVKQYLTDRLFRLGIPLLFFLLLVFGPLHYFLSDTRLNYFEFLANLHFNQPPLSFGHLWFVASLLLYSVLYLVLGKVMTFRFQFSETFRFWYPLLYLLFLIPANVAVRTTYPIDTWVTWLIPIEVAHLPQYLSLFLLGTIACKNNMLENIKPITALIYMLTGILLFMTRETVYSILPAIWGESVTESFLCVGLCLGIISLFKIADFKMNGFIRFLSDNAYGIYLFHLLIVIGLQALLSGIETDTSIKFLLVTIFGILLSALLTAGLRLNSVLKRVL